MLQKQPPGAQSTQRAHFTVLTASKTQHRTDSRPKHYLHGYQLCNEPNVNNMLLVGGSSTQNLQVA